MRGPRRALFLSSLCCGGCSDDEGAESTRDEPLLPPADGHTTEASIREEVARRSRAGDTDGLDLDDEGVLI